MLYCAAATDGLAISVANTRSKLRASANEKLPLPQYSSSKSVSYTHLTLPTKRDPEMSRGLGDVYKRQVIVFMKSSYKTNV
ncbi:hypothetical protein ACX3V1_16985 [Escherichia coli]